MLPSPLAVAFLLILLSWAASVFEGRYLRNGLLALAVAIIYLSSAVSVGDLLLSPLERRYPPLADQAMVLQARCVVVLGSGYAPRDGVPITAALDEIGLVRIAEGFRLLKTLGAAQLVVSGGATKGHGAAAWGYARLAHDFGVPDSAVLVLDSALDTAQEARVIKQRLGRTPFLLVTSAWHMPRAMLQMSRDGVVAIPAPTGQLTGRPRVWSDWLPSAAGLKRTELAIHEYAGLAALSAHLSD